VLHICFLLVLNQEPTEANHSFFEVVGIFFKHWYSQDVFAHDECFAFRTMFAQINSF
jgi:hypothetical protein